MTDIRLEITLTDHQIAYIEQLRLQGIHGATAAEVAKTLLLREIERLASEGFLDILIRQSKSAGFTQKDPD